jgi:predicted nuclease of predicted toxin-antitoxin system
VRLYLDQMLRVDLAVLLREQGHDVVRASETGHDRADDSVILQRAVADQRTLVTLDGHFGDWVVLPLSAHFGVIRVKVHPTFTENIARLLIPLLQNHSQPDFLNKLVILSASRVRWIDTKAE